MHTLHDIVRERVLILDGAMGTMIQRLGLTEEAPATWPVDQRRPLGHHTLVAPPRLHRAERRWLLFQDSGIKENPHTLPRTPPPQRVAWR